MLGQKLFDLHTTRSYALFLLSTLSFTQEFTLFSSLLSFYLLFLFLSPLLLYIFIHCPSPPEETVKKFHVVITANSTQRRDIENGNMEAFVSLRPRAIRITTLGRLSFRRRIMYITTFAKRRNNNAMREMRRNSFSC